MKKPNPAVAISEIRPGQSIELLKELHILTRDGKLNQDTRRKLKQVYHLYQFIEPLLAGAHSLADHGAGKSYLGFILYDLFFKEKATGHIYGIESRKELVEKSRELANRLGFERMSFLDVTVEESTHSSALPEQIDVVTALHACNTATDDAHLGDTRLDGLGHAAGRLDLLDVLPGASGQIVGEALDIGGARPGVDGAAGARLLLDDQLSVARDPRAEVGRQGDGLVEGVRMQ